MMNRIVTRSRKIRKCGNRLIKSSLVEMTKGQNYKALCAKQPRLEAANSKEKEKVSSTIVVQ